MEDTEAPVILGRVRNVTVTEGKDARFTVRFYGKPRPDVVWFLNGKQLRISDRISWMLIEVCVIEGYRLFIIYCCIIRISYVVAHRLASR